MFQGMVGTGDVLAEALLVGSAEAGAVALAEALASGGAPPQSLREPGPPLPWPPRERRTSIRTASPMRIISIDHEAYQRIVLQSEGKG